MCHVPVCTAPGRWLGGVDGLMSLTVTPMTFLLLHNNNNNPQMWCNNNIIINIIITILSSIVTIIITYQLFDRG